MLIVRAGRIVLSLKPSLAKNKVFWTAVPTTTTTVTTVCTKEKFDAQTGHPRPSRLSDSLFLCSNFTLTCDTNIFGIEQMIKNKQTAGRITTRLHSIRAFRHMQLSFEAKLILNTPNAGGSSIESEALSFELLKKYLNARLLKTECEVCYFPQGGCITDYVVSMFDTNTIVGVSVTRAMKHDGSMFDVSDAMRLLTKKLRCVSQSTRNSMLKWHKQILHVWLFDERAMYSLDYAWDLIDGEYKSNTVLLVTLVKNCAELFTNKYTKLRAKKKKKRMIEIIWDY